MAKKSKQSTTANKCGQCKNGYYEETSLNISVDGSYVLITCPNNKYKRLKDMIACSKFENR